MDPITGLKATLCRIEFKAQAGPGENVLLEFADPVPCQAVNSSLAIETMPEGTSAASYDVLQVLVVPREGKDESRWRKDLRALMESPGRSTPILTVKVEDVLVFWRPGWATVQGPQQRMEFILQALAEFAYYEGQLRRIEDEAAAAWPEAEADTPVAHDATRVDAARRRALADRTAATFRRRIRQVRIESHQKESTWLEIILREGMNREIRRLLARVGHKVLRLKRIAIGGVRLKDLVPGEVRRLTDDELKLLRSASRPRRRPQRPPRPPAVSAASTAPPAESAGKPEANQSRPRHPEKQRSEKQRPDKPRGRGPKPRRRGDAR